MQINKKVGNPARIYIKIRSVKSHEEEQNIPEKPRCHCDLDVLPVFSGNSDLENPHFKPFFNVVYHRDPSVPVS